MYINEKRLLATVLSTSNSSGLVRINATGHGLQNGYKVFIEGVGGTVEANGYWTVTRIDDNAFTLDSSTYANTYTSGGLIYAYDRLQITPASDPSTAGECVVFYKQHNPITGSTEGVKNVVKTVDGTAATVLLESVAGYDLAVLAVLMTNKHSSALLYTLSLQSLAATAEVGRVTPVASGGQGVFGEGGGRSQYTATGAIDTP